MDGILSEGLTERCPSATPTTDSTTHSGLTHNTPRKEARTGRAVHQAEMSSDRRLRAAEKRRPL